MTGYQPMPGDPDPTRLVVSIALVVLVLLGVVKYIF